MARVAKEMVRGTLSVTGGRNVVTATPFDTIAVLSSSVVPVWVLVSMGGGLQ